MKADTNGGQNHLAPHPTLTSGHRNTQASPKRLPRAPGQSPPHGYALRESPYNSCGPQRLTTPRQLRWPPPPKGRSGYQGTRQCGKSEKEQMLTHKNISCQSKPITGVTRNSVTLVIPKKRSTHRGVLPPDTRRQHEATLQPLVRTGHGNGQQMNSP